MTRALASDRKLVVGLSVAALPYPPMDDPVQKSSLNPVDPFAQRPTPPPPPRPGQLTPPLAPKPSTPDLRFVESVPRPTPPPAPLSAPKPPVSSPFSSLPAVPPRPAPLNPGQTPTPSVSATQNQEYRTSIRTMTEDISRIKTGQQPLGVDVQKTVQSSRPSTPPLPTPAPIPGVSQGRPSPSLQANLGQTERSKPLAPILPTTVTPPPTPSSVMPSQIIIPENNGSSRNRLYILVALGAILIGGLYWFLSSQNDEVAQTTPTVSATPRITPTATPAPKTLTTLIGGTAQTIELANTGNAITNFWSKVDALALSGAEMRRISVTATTKEQGELTPLELLDRLLISYPAELKTLLTGETAIAVYGQREAFDAKGTIIPVPPVQKRIILFAEIRDSAATTTALKNWEPSMTNALSSLFRLTKTKAATATFLDNIYQTKAIRYRNFAYPDNTMDYSIVQASNGKIYLVFTHSREAVFAGIDKLR